MVMQQNAKTYFNYCGKFSKDKEASTISYHLLPYHSLDVAATAEALLISNKPFTDDLAEFLKIPVSDLIRLLCFLAAIHDLGKFSSAFQSIFEGINPPLYEHKHLKPYDGGEFRHDRLGYYFWRLHSKEILKNITNHDSYLDRDDIDDALDALFVLVESMLGHHGKPINKNAPGSLKDYVDEHNRQASLEFIQDLLKLFNPSLALEKLLSEEWCQRVKQVSWHLAGFAVLSDWLGSNTQFFPYETKQMELIDYWQVAKDNAQQALEITELWQPIQVQSFRSVKEHYGFEPTPLQKWAETIEIDGTSQLFILEDITGAGKTEAALVLTHRLMEQGAATGFYFGLPTMATSNAMFSRVSQHYLGMLQGGNGKKPSIVLAHGAREMNSLFQESVVSSSGSDTDYSVADNTATAQCNSWLADSRKKALLAPVGVGTIDQALLAVLPRRHQSLRLLGLNRKVLIFDEVHAADEYMLELLESLLALHLHQGGSAILLTATLAKKQRQKLINIWAKCLQLGELPIQKIDFPLATKVSANTTKYLHEVPLESKADVSREVAVNLLYSFNTCVEKILESVDEGQCVVWIRNTVDDALAAYRAIESELNTPTDCMLFHSRFTLLDRKTTENKVLTILGKKSNGSLRKGKVLIATQVFQESLDADADVMISDICPIDDLIQRAGRLHRHTRNNDGAYQAGVKDSRNQPTLYVHAPKWDENPTENWLSREFQGTQYVYRSPGRLWLAMRELLKLGAMRMPQHARQLIEAVYSEEAYEQIPKSLKNQENKAIGEGRSKAAKAQTSILDWQHHGYSSESAGAWHEDDTDISTRHSDIETAEVVLLKEKSNGELEFWAGSQPFSMQLSILKLSVNKYVKKLRLLSVDDVRLQELKERSSRLKYLNLWLPEADSSFGYDVDFGFYEKESPC